MATQTEDAPFELRSLISKAGSGSNGELLVNAIDNFYPAEIQAAQLRKPNVELSDGLDIDAVSKIARITVEDAVVVGGERKTDDAIVRYVGYNDAGDTIKGVFPFADLGSGKSDSHVSQRDSLNDSRAARDQAHADAKKDAAPDGDEDALKARIAELEAQVADGGTPDAGPSEPVPGYDEANADDIVKDLAEADRSTAADVLDYEQAASKPRKTVLAAAESRLEALDEEDAAKDAALAENEALKARIAELEGQGS